MGESAVNRATTAFRVVSTRRVDKEGKGGDDIGHTRQPHGGVGE